MPEIQNKLNMTVLPIHVLVMAAGFVLILLGSILLVVGLRRIGKSKKTEACKRAAMAAMPKVYEYSAIGKRSSQQDACLSSNTIPAYQRKERGVLALVCDGMGGMEGGELASRVCSELVLNGYYEQRGLADPEKMLKQLIEQANQRVAKLCAPDGRVLNSGTTIVAAVVKDGVLFWASVGDSRIYLYQEGYLQQLTRDHAFRAQLMEQYKAGALSLDEVEMNPQKNALISYVGKGGGLIVDTGRRPFKPENGDVLVLCSDGLYKALSRREIQGVIQTCANEPEKLPKTLVTTALENRRIRHDNITVMIISE